MYLKPLKPRLCEGHTTMQRPHLMHFSSSTMRGLDAGIAPTGHKLTHFPHSLHVLVAEG